MRDTVTLISELRRRHEGQVQVLLNALGAIQQLTMDIEDVNIRNIPDDEKLRLVDEYNGKIAEICADQLPG